jgi:F0F1-type ATP synthase assembly protein I
VEDDKKNSNSDNLSSSGRPGWVSALSVFSEISTWIIVPILLALFAGKALDAHFGTKPVIFLTLVGAAFVMTCYGIVRVVKNYKKKLEEK